MIELTQVVVESVVSLAVSLYGLNPVESAPYVRGERDRFEAVYARMREAGLVVRMRSTARLEAVGGGGTLVTGAAQARRGQGRAEGVAGGGRLAPTDVRR